MTPGPHDYLLDNKYLSTLPAAGTADPVWTYSFGAFVAHPTLIERGELQHIVVRGLFACGQENGWTGGTFETTNCLGCLTAYDPRPWWRRLF